MFDYDEESYKFNSKDDYKKWLTSQDWYQTIHTSSGIVTRGKVETDLRVPFLESIEFSNKSVLDIGCNSGQYSILAKKMGADNVVGIDISAHRIEQARRLAANEDCSVSFGRAGIDSVTELGKFDVVICFAVLTEIENVLGGLKAIKGAASQLVLIEMALAKPVLYFSRSLRWLRRDPRVSRLGKLGEFHRHKHAGWVIHPTLDVVSDIFSPEYTVELVGNGVRYDLIKITRNAAA